MLWTWLAALAFGQALFNINLAKKWRFLLGLLVVAQLYVRLSGGNQEWVSGWLPPLVAAMVIVWLYNWRLGLSVTLAAGAGLLVYYTVLHEAVWTDSQQYSAFSRAATWPIMLEIVKVNPILGVGPANYYYYTPLYSIWGWYVKFNSHNNYWDILAQTGLLGLSLFGWLVFELGRLGWRLRWMVQDSFSRGYAAAALGGLAAMLFSGMMGDWFLPFLYNIGFPGFRASIFAWLFLGGLLALNRIHNDGH
jgi:O-antigen ligase